MTIETRRCLVLWDVDGTLISNSQSDEDLFVWMIGDVLGPQDRIEHPYRHGKTDRMMVREYVMANGGSPEDVPRAAERLVELSRERFAAPATREPSSPRPRPDSPVNAVCGQSSSAIPKPTAMQRRQRVSSSSAWPRASTP